MNVVISAGHAKDCRGATGAIDEYDENCRVVDRVFEYLTSVGYGVAKFKDTVSDDPNENLNRIVDFHNSKTRDLDVSIHFNAFKITNKPMGTECLYVTQDALAQRVATGISNASGLPNRGAKKRTNLFFLNNTEKPAILIEVCFVDSTTDVALYDEHFDEICRSISDAICGVVVNEPKLFYVKGKVSYFGGPDDEGVSPSEGLAFYSRVEEAPQLFLAVQPEKTTGLARRLNPYIFYVACRWDYDKTPKSVLQKELALVRAGNVAIKAFPADWGPNESTGRVADLSPGLMDALGIETDDEVEVTFPFKT